MRKSTLVVRAAVVTGLCAMSLSLVGCRGGADSRHAEFLGNPTPDLDTYAETRADINNRHTTVLDTDFRRLNYEMDKFFLIDRPRRGGYPIPY